MKKKCGYSTDIGNSLTKSILKKKTACACGAPQQVFQVKYLRTQSVGNDLKISKKHFCLVGVGVQVRGWVIYF